MLIHEWTFTKRVYHVKNISKSKFLCRTSTLNGAVFRSHNLKGCLLLCMHFILYPDNSLYRWMSTHWNVIYLKPSVEQVEPYGSRCKYTQRTRIFILLLKYPWNEMSESTEINQYKIFIERCFKYFHEQFPICKSISLGYFIVGRFLFHLGHYRNLCWI